MKNAIKRVQSDNGAMRGFCGAGTQIPAFVRFILFSTLLIFPAARFAAAAVGEPVIKLDSQTRALTVELTFDTNFNVKSYPLNTNNNPRFVIDISGAKLSESTFKPGNEFDLAINSKTVDSVRVAQFSRNPDVVRVVIDLTRAGQGFIVEQDRGAHRLTVREGSLPRIPDPGVWTGATGTALSFSYAGRESGVSVTTAGGSLSIAFSNYQAQNPGGSIRINSGIVESMTWKQDGNAAVAVVRAKQTPLFTREYRADQGKFVVTILQPAGGTASAGSAAPRAAAPAPQAYQPAVRYGSMSQLHVCVDAGHGGNDPGAQGRDGTQEKTITLDVADRLRKLLTSQGARVTMTRSTDDYISLSGRVDIANAAGCDLFVSVHINALADHEAKHLDKRGTQTYYYSDTSKDFARVMLEEMRPVMGLGDRGMFQRKFYVIRYTKMPAVLLELAFITQPDDLAVLQTAEFRENSARGAFNGIVAYTGIKTAKYGPLALPYAAASRMPRNPGSLLAKQLGDEPPVAVAAAPRPAAPRYVAPVASSTPSAHTSGPYMAPEVDLYGVSSPPRAAASSSAPATAAKPAIAAAKSKTVYPELQDNSLKVPYQRTPPRFLKEPWQK